MFNHFSPIGNVRRRLVGAVIAGGLLAAACGSDATQPTIAAESTASTTTGEASSITTAATSEETPTTAASGGAVDLGITALPPSLSALGPTMTKYVSVWGVHIVGTGATDDAKISHAANVMAQYLDNDADGTPDNPAVVDALVANQAILLMGSTPEEFESVGDSLFAAIEGMGGQDLYASETRLDRGFDAALEEVHHLLLNFGWATVFPDQLAQAKGSAIANAMDSARGGQFDTIPSPYPAGAWYTYNDETCNYTCMITEYSYWAHTSLLGAQEGRGGEIGGEWKLETADKVRATDAGVAAILEDPALSLPTVLPNGNYTG